MIKRWTLEAEECPHKDSPICDLTSEIPFSVEPTEISSYKTGQN